MSRYIVRHSTSIAFLVLFCSGFVILGKVSISQAQAISPTPPIVATIALTGTPTSLPIPTSTLSVEEQLTNFRQELREQQYQFLEVQANSAINQANLVVQWSGFFLTAFTIVVAIASFFGFREYQNIREQYQEAEKLKRQFEEHLRSVESIEKSIDEQLKGLASKFERESQTFIEASYNFSEATVAYKQGDNIKAIEYFTRVTRLQPLNTKVYCRIGRAFTNLGETQKAIESFHQALSIDANNAEALRGLSTSYRYIDAEKALEYAKRAVEEDPTDNEGFDYLGLLYRDKLSIAEAIEAHEQARRLRQRPETDFFLALLHAHQKDNERAKLMILTANLGLREEQVRDRIRPLWAILLNWGKLTLENSHDEALIAANDLLTYMTTPRVALAVFGHVTFLLSALDKEELITTYKNLFQPKMEV